MDPPPLAPSAFPGNDIGPTEIVEFDQDEAMLSQLLLRNLDSDLDLTSAALQQRESAAVGLSLGGLVDIAMDSVKRERIIMTCERRGSESTVASSDNSHGYSPSSPSFPLPLPLHLQRHRFTLESSVSATTLYEPSSPASQEWKEKTLDLPPSPIYPVEIMHGGEQCLPTHPDGDVLVHDALSELKPVTETAAQSPSLVQPVDPSFEQSDDDATPRALSPS
jgi:hypothetical protein